MRKIFIIGISFLILSCAKETTNLIGISKIVSHPALDAVEKGIQDELNERKIKANFDLHNANGDINTALSIAKKFKEQKVKIAVGIATPSAQTLVKELKDTSTIIIFSAVTDPVKAGLVNSLERGERNITGISDMTPVEAQIKLITQIKPIKKLGFIYSSHEDNAVALAKITKNICSKLNIELIEATITSSSDVKQATIAIANRVDAIYVTTDNTVVSALPSLTEVAMKYKIPVISADPSSAKDSQVLAALGFDYYKMGKATGKLIIEILEGKKPENIPTRFLTDRKDLEFYLNLEIAKKLNLNIPEKLIDEADVIVK